MSVHTALAGLRALGMFHLLKEEFHTFPYKGKGSLNPATSYVISSGGAKDGDTNLCAPGQSGSDPPPADLRMKFMGFGYTLAPLFALGLLHMAPGIPWPHSSSLEQQYSLSKSLSCLFLCCYYLDRS